MSDHSAIEWCDATWNPTTGCTKVSPGCANCYIETTTPFRMARRKFVRGATDLQLHTGRLEQPIRWRKPKRIFVNSLSDLFHEDIPDAFIDQVFNVMAQTSRHTYQLLTKRATRMQRYSAALAALDPQARARRILGSMYAEHPARRLVLDNIDDAHLGAFPWPLPNVWLGVSVENQHFADERIPLLLQTPAATRFISAEPLLGPVNLEPWLPVDTIGGVEMERWLDWVIVGGESGPGARPMEVEWARAIVKQCRVAGVACFVKQLGAVPLVPAARLRHHEWGEGKFEWWQDDRSGVWRVKLHDKKGGDTSEWPADLRVREFPKVAA